MSCREGGCRGLLLFIIIGLGSSFAYSERADLRKIASNLKNTYLGKEIILKNFYCGPQLQYSSSSPLHMLPPQPKFSHGPLVA
jgi:hypothetical protein